jgi:hypothetical protein
LSLQSFTQIFMLGMGRHRFGGKHDGESLTGRFDMRKQVGNKAGKTKMAEL